MDECDMAQRREAMDLSLALAAQAKRAEPVHDFCRGCDDSQHGEQMTGCECYAECLSDWQKREKARVRNGK